MGSSLSACRDESTTPRYDGTVTSHFVTNKRTVYFRNALERAIRHFPELISVAPSIGDADFVWTAERGSALLFQRLSEFPNLRVNRYPSMTFICSKHMLAQQQQFFQRVCETELDNIPLTYYLRSSSQLEIVKSMMQDDKHATMILKPSYGSQGIGISVARTFEEVRAAPRKTNLVAQHYIDNPLLLDGLKFDFRMYVLVTNLEPFEAYLIHEGIVRFCSRPYMKLSSSGHFDRDRHLTNVAVNKQSQYYKHENDYREETCSLRRISTVLSQLGVVDSDSGDESSLSSERQRSPLGSETRFWSEAQAVCEQALAVVYPLIYDRFRSVVPDGVPTSQCFHVLGFDILPDDTGHLWLTEINANCAFRINGAVHASVTLPVFETMLRLLGILGPWDGEEEEVEVTQLDPTENFPHLMVFAQDHVKALFEDFGEGRGRTRRALWNFFGQKRVPHKGAMWFNGVLTFDTFCRELVDIARAEYPDMGTRDAVDELIARIPID